MKRLLCTILIIIQIACLAACGKPKKTNIESKYNIEIHTDKEAFIIEIEDYFSKMPEGFIDELLVRDENSNRKIKIYVEETKDDITCKWDAESGFIWIIDDDSRADWQLGYCTMKAIIKNMNNREEDEGFFDSWSELNPKGFSYEDSDFEKYKFNPENPENSYFTSDIKPDNLVIEISRMFSLLVSSDVDIVTAIKDAPHIRDKFKYLCEEINRAFETVNGKTYWSRYFY